MDFATEIAGTTGLHGADVFANEDNPTDVALMLRWQAGSPSNGGSALADALQTLVREGALVDRTCWSRLAGRGHGKSPIGPALEFDKRTDGEGQSQ